MTFTDIIILFITTLFVGGVLYRMTRRKDESSCRKCSYAKKR